MSRRVRVTAAAPQPDLIAEAVGLLKRGGIVAYATDTLYGLAVNPRSDAAVGRLFASKGRPQTSAVPLVASSLEQARLAGEFDDLGLWLSTVFWPGPLSIVVPARGELSRALLAGGSTIAIRVPDHPVACALAEAFGFCVTATSANASGEPAPYTADGVEAQLSARVDLILDSGPAPGGPPSTLVALESGRPVLVREGAVPWERVLRSLE